MEVWVANDDLLGSLSTGLEISFSTSLSWDMSYGSHTPVNEEGRAIGVWNLGGGFTSVQDFDNISPDHVFWYGVAMPGSGLPAGPTELCYSMIFDVPPEVAEAEAGICVTPYFYPAAGTWSFYDNGGSYPPDFCGQEVPSETDPVADPVCFDVKVLCGDADASGFVNITDCVYLLSFIFGGGPEPIPYISGDVDCNGSVNVADAVYVRNYIFGGPEPCAECP
jgi:hypothetical protein